MMVLVSVLVAMGGLKPFGISVQMCSVVVYIGSSVHE